MERRSFLWLITWMHLVTSSMTQTLPMTSGSQTRTRFRKTFQVNTVESCSDGRLQGGTSFQSWVNVCWSEQLVMFPICSGFSNGIWNGTRTHTPQLHYKLQEPRHFRQMNSFYKNGACYTIQIGYLNSGLFTKQGALQPHLWNLTVISTWKAWISGSGPTTLIGLTGGLPRSQPTAPSPLCLGRTGRKWGCKQSLLRRRRRRRTKASHASSLWHRSQHHSRRLRRDQFPQHMCPSSLHTFCMSLFAWFSNIEGEHPCVQSRHLFRMNAWMAQKIKGRPATHLDIMSESDPEAPWTIGPDAGGPAAGGPAGPGPAGPAGPPPPQPVDSWRGLSHAFSGAILQVLDTRYATTFTGSILTYLPQELLRPYHSLNRLVVSIRPMRPHEYNHPLILEAGEMEEDTGGDTATTTGSAGPTEPTGTTVVSGPRPPSTPPPTHLLTASTEPAAPTTSEAETELATVLTDITTRMEAEGRTEERLISAIMEPEPEETTVVHPRGRGGRGDHGHRGPSYHPSLAETTCHRQPQATLPH